MLEVVTCNDSENGRAEEAKDLEERTPIMGTFNHDSRTTGNEQMHRYSAQSFFRRSNSSLSSADVSVWWDISKCWGWDQRLVIAFLQSQRFFSLDSLRYLLSVTFYFPLFGCG